MQCATLTKLERSKKNKMQPIFTPPVPQLFPCQITTNRDTTASVLVKEAGQSSFQDGSPALDLWEPVDSGVGLELSKTVGVNVDGKDHTLSAVRVGGLVSLFAVKVSRLVAFERDVKGFEVGDVVGVEVAKVGIELSPWDLGAWLLEAGLGEGVVDGAEVEVDALALSDAVDVGWVKDELLVWAN
jgi:hypothetical protein